MGGVRCLQVTIMNNGTKPPQPDPTAKLRLGSVGPNGPGQLPYVALAPTNGNTAAGEFSLPAPS